MSNFVRILSVLGLLVVVMAIGTGVASAGRPDGEDDGHGNDNTIISMPTRSVREARAGGGSTASPLAFRGGAVQTNTKVYISYWGSEWSDGTTNGFSTGGYTSKQARTYIESFFSGVGESSWIGTDTEYCQSSATATVAPGSTSCPSGAAFILNNPGQFVSTNAWNDTSPVPSRPRQSDIAAAAIRLMNAKGGYDPQATYMVFTPTKKSMVGFGTQWCAWHSSTSTSSGRIAYAYIPYMPDAGGSCGMNWPTPGYFNGFSIVAGHEYEEAQTDPFPNGGWLDQNGAENADKCAWSALSGTVTLTNSLSFVVQPLWSNKKGGCVLSTP